MNTHLAAAATEGGKLESVSICYLAQIQTSQESSPSILQQLVKQGARTYFNRKKKSSLPHTNSKQELNFKILPNYVMRSFQKLTSKKHAFQEILQFMDFNVARTELKKKL